MNKKAHIALLLLSDAIMLGFWAKDEVTSLTSGQCGDGEIAFSVADAAEVEATLDDWEASGLTIIQSPTPMGLGTTFVATEPNGHRLRVSAPVPA